MAGLGPVGRGEVRQSRARLSRENGFYLGSIPGLPMEVPGPVRRGGARRGWVRQGKANFLKGEPLWQQEKD